MTDLRGRFAAILRQHWRAMLDHGGPTDAVLDGLVALAEEMPITRPPVTMAAGATQGPTEPPATQPPPARPARQRSASTARQAGKPRAARTTRKDPA